MNSGSNEGIEFTKLESAGNDFVLIEENRFRGIANEFARQICNRHFGAGADGLLIFSGYEGSNLGMKIYNADGSEAEACGNGMRAIVKYALDRGLVRSGQEISVKTASGPRIARVISSGQNQVRIEASMGMPVFEPSRIPLDITDDQIFTRKGKLITDYPVNVFDRTLVLSFLSMGNPHAVHFINGPVDLFPLETIGPVVENLSIFPKRTNFEIARLTSRHEIQARVWERGVGETLACGSGACAIGVTSMLLGKTDNPVDVSLPGGKLSVSWDGSGEVYLAGPARTVYTGGWNPR